ncbi:hypothetical protein EV2_015498 [Malus domestica]
MQRKRDTGSMESKHDLSSRHLSRFLLSQTRVSWTSSSSKARCRSSNDSDELLKSSIAICISYAFECVFSLSMSYFISSQRSFRSAGENRLTSRAFSFNWTGSEWSIAHCNIPSREEKPMSASRSATAVSLSRG